MEIKPENIEHEIKFLENNKLFTVTLRYGNKKSQFSRFYTVKMDQMDKFNTIWSTLVKDFIKHGTTIL